MKTKIKKSNFGSFHIFGNKYFEWQLDLLTNLCNWISFKCYLTEKCDHAGFTFELSLFKLFFVSFIIYDNRHWNYEKNRWYLHNEEINEWKDSKAACKENKFSRLFDSPDGDKLLMDSIHLQTKLDSIFLEVKKISPKATQFYSEMSLAISDMQDWLRYMLYGTKKK